MIRSLLQCILIPLDSKLRLPKYRINIPNIIPQITGGKRILIALKDSPLKARIKKMILMISKTTKSHVIPQLQRLVTQLDQPLIQLDSYLRLILIKKIRSNIRNSLDITILNTQRLFIVQMRFLYIMQLVVYPTDSYIQFRLKRMSLLTLLQYIYRSLYIVLLLVYFTQVEVC